LQPSLAQSSIQQLGGIGTTNLAYQQAILDAQRQAAQTAAYEPYQRAQFLQNSIGALTSGYPQTSSVTGPQQATTSPLASALSGAATIYGLGSLFGGR
jgi:energy-converting hydrogenase Eha subunit F